MAVDPIVEEYGLPVNAQGEIVASWGTGDTTVSGVLPPGFVPVRADNGKVPINLPAVPTTNTFDVTYYNANVTPAPSAARSTYWDMEYDCLVTTMSNGVKIQVGQEFVVLCIAGENISNGDIVYVSSGGASDHPTVFKASNSSYTQATSAMGMATHSAVLGEHIVITRMGIVHDLNTASYTRGQTVYLGATAGSITANKPSADNTVVRVGYVHVVDSTLGEVLVDMQVELSTSGAYVDAQVRTASVSVPTTPTVFVWDTEVSDIVGMYNPSSGEITIPFTGQWSFVFSYNASSAVATKNLYAAAQIWNGSAWVSSEYSTRQDAVRNGESRQVLFTSQNQFSAGTRLRFAVWGQSNLTINTQTITTGYTVPAARLLITGVKTV